MKLRSTIPNGAILRRSCIVRPMICDLSWHFVQTRPGKIAIVLTGQGVASPDRPAVAGEGYDKNLREFRNLQALPHGCNWATCNGAASPSRDRVRRRRLSPCAGPRGLRRNLPFPRNPGAAGSDLGRYSPANDGTPIRGSTSRAAITPKGGNPGIAANTKRAETTYQVTRNRIAEIRSVPGTARPRSEGRTSARRSEWPVRFSGGSREGVSRLPLSDCRRRLSFPPPDPPLSWENSNNLCLYFRRTLSLRSKPNNCSPRITPELARLCRFHHPATNKGGQIDRSILRKI